MKSPRIQLSIHPPIHPLPHGPLEGTPLTTLAHGSYGSARLVRFAREAGASLAVMAAFVGIGLSWAALECAGAALAQHWQLSRAAAATSRTLVIPEASPYPARSAEISSRFERARPSEASERRSQEGAS